MNTIITVFLRSGKKLEVSNDYSTVARFISENYLGEAMLLIDVHNADNQYFVRKDAIDYIEQTIN